MANSISKFYKSFSGTDTLAFIIMPGCTPVVIGSLTTISYSMFRNKKPVINIGRTNINGVTRGSRIFAGTMIFTLINQHWLKELQEQEAVKYLEKFKELKVDELPLFDIMIISANEYGNAVSMYIFGIDFTDEAQTISVEDLFTENTFSFVARDVSNFRKITKKGGANKSSPKSHNELNDYSQRYYVLNSSNISFDDLGRLEQSRKRAKTVERQRKQDPVLQRDLFLTSSKLKMGNDVAEIQMLLGKLLKKDANISGIFDEDTDKLVREFQSKYNTGSIDGVVDNRLYKIMLNETYGKDKGIRLGMVINKNGTMGHRYASSNSDIHHSLNYKEYVDIYGIEKEEGDSEQRWYKTNKGYVMYEDIYAGENNKDITEFPILKYKDKSQYVTMLNDMLSKIDNKLKSTNEFGDDTLNLIRKLQKENGLISSGIVDNYTWLLIKSLVNRINKITNTDNFVMLHDKMPGRYKITKEEIKKFRTTVICDNPINIKVTITVKYKKGKYKTYHENILLEKRTAGNIPLEKFDKAFNYNAEYGEPDSIEYTVYAYNKNPYKWNISLKES